MNSPLKYHGGKYYLAKWLHSIAPPSVLDDPMGYTHRNIVFAGGLSELMDWQPIERISETVNDLNLELTNFWKVIAYQKSFLSFKRTVEAIPLSEIEFNNATQPSKFVSDAVRFFVRNRQSRQGLGASYATPTKRLRRGMNENVSSWLSAVDGLPEVHERLRTVEIRRMDCIEFIDTYDQDRALFYCDPPYLHETRAATRSYGPFEMSDEQHEELLAKLATIKGKFMLSGYHSPLYDSWANHSNFRCFERPISNNAASGSSKRRMIECCWTNY